MNRLAVWVEFVLRDGASGPFLGLVRENAAASLAREPGCRRFDVLLPQDADIDVALYEIYDDASAFAEHLASAHYASFARLAGPLVREKRVRKLAVDSADQP